MPVQMSRKILDYKCPRCWSTSRQGRRVVRLEQKNVLHRFDNRILSLWFLSRWYACRFCSHGGQETHFSHSSHLNAWSASSACLSLSSLGGTKSSRTIFTIYSES